MPGHHLLVNFHLFISICGENLSNLCVGIIRRHKIKTYGSPEKHTKTHVV